MKILKISNSRSGSFKSMKNSLYSSSKRKKNPREFDFFLNEFFEDPSFQEIDKDWNDWPVLLPVNGRFWDNGYEDVDKEEL